MGLNSEFQSAQTLKLVVHPQQNEAVESCSSRVRLYYFDLQLVLALLKCFLKNNFLYIKKIPQNLTHHERSFSLTLILWHDNLLPVECLLLLF